MTSSYFLFCRKKSSLDPKKWTSGEDNSLVKNPTMKRCDVHPFLCLNNIISCIALTPSCMADFKLLNSLIDCFNVVANLKLPSFFYESCFFYNTCILAKNEREWSSYNYIKHWCHGRRIHQDSVWEPRARNSRNSVMDIDVDTMYGQRVCRSLFTSTITIAVTLNLPLACG